MAKVEDTSFRPVGRTDQAMPGAPGVIIAGASAAEQRAVREVMDAHGLEGIPLVVLTAETMDTSLADLAQLPDGTGMGQEAHLPRAVVMSGLTERQFHELMDQYRLAGLPRPLWATVTPVSAAWSAKYLLVELLKEQQALREAASGDKVS